MRLAAAGTAGEPRVDWQIHRGGDWIHQRHPPGRRFRPGVAGNEWRADHFRWRTACADGVHAQDFPRRPRDGCAHGARYIRVPWRGRLVTGRSVAPTIAFAERLAALGKPVWVRYVLVPCLTDDPPNIRGVARFVAQMPNVEWVEVLPFHQMGSIKWKALGLDYRLAGTPPCPHGLLSRAIGQFRDAGCRAS